MVLSPHLLAKMSVTPTYSGGVTSWSILMDYRYPFPWQTVSAFVLRQKAKGPPDDMVTLEVDRNIYKYTVKIPWYARLVLGKSILWHDLIEIDRTSQVLSEDGQNMNLQRLGSVRDISTWRSCKEDANVTIYNKRVDFNIRMPVGPTVMMQVAQPLIRWFETKSQLCRELETEAIREYLAAQEGYDEEEKTAARRSTEEEINQEARDAAVGNRTPLSGKENARDSAEGDLRRATRIVKARANAKAAVAAGVAVAKSRRTAGFESED